MKIILYTLTTALSIFFFKEIEWSLFNLGASWTLSKAIPYLLNIVLGALLAITLYKSISLKKILKITFSVLLLLLPFGISFALHPIYQGDFSKNGKVLNQNSYNENTIENGLMVITIPNCPYCYEAIGRLKTLAKRNSNLKIEFVVCSSDSNSLTTYQEEIDGLFDIRLAKDRNKLARVAERAFPAFVEIKNNKFTYKWSNSQFGVRALDLIEDKTGK
jgi:hypothetical protein